LQQLANITHSHNWEAAHLFILDVFHFGPLRAYNLHQSMEYFVHFLFHAMGIMVLRDLTVSLLSKGAHDIPVRNSMGASVRSWQVSHASMHYLIVFQLLHFPTWLAKCTF